MRHYRLCKAFIVLIGLWCFTASGLPALAAPIWEATPLSYQDVQQPDVDYLPDPQAQFTPEALLSGEVNVRWQRVHVSDTSFGYTQTPYWFRLRLYNPSQSATRRYLVLPLPYMDHVEAWRVSSHEVQAHYVLGEAQPYESRLIDHPDYIIPVTVPAGATQTWLFRLQTQGAMEFPLEIWKPEAFWTHQVRSQQGLGLFYGFMLLGVVLTFLLWLRMRKAVHGYYLLFMGTALLLIAAQNGDTFRYFWPDHPALQNLILFLAVPLCTLGALEFSRRFLNLRRHTPPFDTLLKLLSGLILLHLIMLPILPASWAARQAMALGMVAALLLVVSGPLALAHRQPGAWFYNIGWLFLEMAVLVSGLQKFGWLPANSLTLNSLLYGLGIQTAMLTFGLVDQIYRERTLRIHAEKARTQLEQQRAEAAEAHLFDATHDPVTRLPNRTVFVNRLQTELDIRETVSVLLIRFNRLRDIDRTLGQTHADAVIRLAADKLASSIEHLTGQLALTDDIAETVARLNGSTFGLVLDSRLSGDVHLQITPLLKRLREKLIYQNMPLDLDPRIGLACAPEHGKDATQLLRKAQIAVDMSLPTQPVCRYLPQADPYSPRRLTLLSELDEAIRKGQLQLHLQPQLEMTSSNATTFEALTRWVHPQHGSIPPMEFIGLAEETGLIHRLTHWVIEEAIRLLGELDRDGFPDTRISVNVSAKDLAEEDFVPFVLSMLARSGQPASRLILEITETAVMADPETAVTRLQQLSAEGITLALDDYGAGYSSLHQIKRLPLHEIKIDRSLMADINDSVDGRLILQTTVQMCHSLGYQVVAEGIEDDATLRTLRELRCDLAQGFHIARPMPYDFLLEWLRNHSTRSQSA